MKSRGLLVLIGVVVVAMELVHAYVVHLRHETFRECISRHAVSSCRIESWER